MVKRQKKAVSSQFTQAYMTPLCFSSEYCYPTECSLTDCFSSALHCKTNDGRAVDRLFVYC